MNKLEIISELLVNELTDFEKNVKQLGQQVDRAESLRVKFDISPIKGLISQLEEYGRRETDRRDQYLNRLERNLEQAKIYPKWAVITFISALLIAFGTSFFAYYNYQKAKDEKVVAYNEGTKRYENFINDFFKSHPESKKKFLIWYDQKTNKQ